MNPNYVWGSILGAGFLYEAYALFSKKGGDTLSERTRAWFKTSTKPGKVIFGLAWVGFSLWFLVHILGE